MENTVDQEKKEAYLVNTIFEGLENLNTKSKTVFHFSPDDFEKVLEKCAHLGIGIYQIDAIENDAIMGSKTHNDFKKKATDPRWAKSAFIAFQKEGKKLTYSATFKVSSKLLDKQSS